MVIDRTALRVAPSVRVLGAARERTLSGAPGALAVAVPEVAGAPRLEYALHEAQLVEDVAGGTVRAGPDATCRVVEQEMREWEATHFACHADANPSDALLSAIYLEDAPLTLRHLLEARLEASRLVVLSACETAVQDLHALEEKFSLASGMLHAGASGVVGSLWAVVDRSTMLLMWKFHTLRQAQVDSCQALRQAQLWLRDSSGADLNSSMEEAGRDMSVLVEDLRDAPSQPYEFTYFWAGFTYTGA
jgi:CHAT domain-containing protein